MPLLFASFWLYDFSFAFVQLFYLSAKGQLSSDEEYGKKCVLAVGINLKLGDCTEDADEWVYKVSVLE